MQVVGRIVGWVLLRSLLFALVAGIAALLVSGAQQLFGANLRWLAFSIFALLLLWGLANAVVSALANGALGALLDRLYREATGAASEIAQPAARRPLAGGALPASLLFGGAAVALAGGLYLGGNLAERVSAERDVEIIAHRGAAGARPENTMAAVEQALADHADWVEIDVQETADGEVVVAHDSDFMKLAGVDLKVWDTTMADLAEINIGSWFDPAYAGERTPTLREVLHAAKGRGKILIELKYYGHDVALESRVAEIVEETGMSADVGVMSLKIPGVRKMHALRPDWPHGILAATAVGDLSALDADFLAVNTGQVSLDLIRRTHAQGRKLYVWTVDDPVTMVRMISMGVDGLITNEPALARQVMEARNRLSAPERLLLWASDRFRLKSFDLVAEETDA
jgi:glycerophosphoryl diester phosphodiesterase